MQMTNSAKILVVDDDPLSRKLLLQTLENAGYSCVEADNGIAALEMAQAEKPALLLLDYHMPGVNGAEVLRRLRAEGNSGIAQIPTIMLTGHGGEESEVRCLEAGADDFVTKPINTEVLRARIETQLRLHSMRRQLEQQNDELEAWRKNLELDLAAARLTQRSLIPHKPPAIPGWEIAAAYRPVIQVGGDIYGWLRLKDGRTLFWIADATGHGASAALLTTLAKLLFHHGTAEHGQPTEIMEAVNNDFRSIFGARSFMTAMCVALDPASGDASVVGAGHPPLVLRRCDGVTQTFLSSAPPLGLVKRSQFTETKVQLAPGDLFLLYTDGLYGGDEERLQGPIPERLIAMLPSAASSAKSLLDGLLEKATSPGTDKPPADDMAVVVVRRLPAA
jgi:phosphoserine phosphatase RsbU/P